MGGCGKQQPWGLDSQVLGLLVEKHSGLGHNPGPAMIPGYLSGWVVTPTLLSLTFPSVKARSPTPGI